MKAIFHSRYQEFQTHQYSDISTEMGWGGGKESFIHGKIAFLFPRNTWKRWEPRRVFVIMWAVLAPH
jgi:hypothetical protein